MYFKEHHKNHRFINWRKMNISLVFYLHQSCIYICIVSRKIFIFSFDGNIARHLQEFGSGDACLGRLNNLLWSDVVFHLWTWYFLTVGESKVQRNILRTVSYFSFGTWLIMGYCAQVMLNSTWLLQGSFLMSLYS